MIQFFIVMTIEYSNPALPASTGRSIRQKEANG
jgi:hypothetical protein